MPVLRDWDLALDADKVLWGQGVNPTVMRAGRPKLAALAKAVYRRWPSFVIPSSSLSSNPRRGAAARAPAASGRQSSWLETMQTASPGRPLTSSAGGLLTERE